MAIFEIRQAVRGAQRQAATITLTFNCSDPACLQPHSCPYPCGRVTLWPSLASCASCRAEAQLSRTRASHCSDPRPASTVLPLSLRNCYMQEGDAVAEFDKLCEVQSDKATIEITSRYKGMVVRLHHAKGDIVKVGNSTQGLQVTLAFVSYPIL